MYTIKFNEEFKTFVMDGEHKYFIGEHLEVIGKKEKIGEVDAALSEGHMLAILQENGIKVELLEEDGSKMDW